MELQKLQDEFIQNGGEFKDFLIGDVFSILTPRKRFDANKIKLGGKFPYVVRTALNNGIKGFITENEIYLNDGNTLSFGQDTATIFYQKKPYFTGDKIKVMKCKNENFNDKNAMFILAAMNKSFQNFSWGTTSFKIDILENTKITLPYYKSNNQIAFDYMEKYIKFIEIVKINTLKNYLISSNFITNDYKNIDLTEQEKSALLLFKNLKNNNQISWKSFMLNEIFCISGSKTTPKNELERMGIGNYPYITTQATNNGIAGYYSCATENGNCLTIDSAVLGTCFYQENEFSASDHVEVLRPKNFSLDKKIALFFVCLLNKTGNILEYSYGKKRSQKALKNESIFLPITNDGNINFELMQNLISAIEKIIVNNLIQKLNNNNN